MLVIPSLKKISRLRPVHRLADPVTFYLPLDAYRGRLAPLVKEGERVLKYQLLAKTEGTFATFLHAPVSGEVGAIEEHNGKCYLQLFNDFEEEELPLEPLDEETLQRWSAEDVLARIRTYGIEGSGGAQFPTHLKYAVQQQQIDTFIINGAECEPFLTADFALMKNYTDELVRAAGLIQQLLGAGEVVFAIEQHNRRLRPILEQAMDAQLLNGRIQLLPNTYPQGGELQLIRSVTGKELSKGSIPAQSGVVVNNVGTVHAIYRAIFEGKPYIERLVTLFSEKEKKGANYWLKVGTPVQHLLDVSFFRKEKKENASWVLGGPMMGKEVQDMLQPIQKGSGGVLMLHKIKTNSTNCINCGYCADVCPQRLLPLEFVRNYMEGTYAQLQEYNLMDCIECGACSYICPSDVPLMLSIKKGKEVLLQQN